MADKTKSIKSATDKELDYLLVRLRKERELQSLITDLKRRSEPYNPYSDNVPYDRPGISTDKPIESLYHKTDEVLTHFGVRGMKWGIRNKTGPDGLVINRKSSSDTLVSDKKSNTKGSDDYKEARRLWEKDAKDLSNKELQTLNQRLQLERQMRDLTLGEYTKGIEPVKAILSVGTTLASVYALSNTPAGQAIRKAVVKA